MSSHALSLAQARSYLRQGKPEAALPLVLKALRDSPNLAEAHALLSRIHHAQGKMELALAAAERALQLAPGHGGHATFLGKLFVELKLYEFALPLLQGASTSAGDSFETLEALANCSFDMERGHEALPLFARAVATAPDDIARDAVRLRMAECLAAINDVEKAEALLLDLSTASTCADKALLLRGLTCRKPVDAKLVAALEAMVARRDLNAEFRSQLLLALGRCADLTGAHDDAFKFWSQSRALLGVRTHSADAVKIRNMQTQGFYAKGLLEAAKPFGDPRRDLVFIAGMPRSGTTLTAQILGAHSMVSSIGETDRMNKLDVVFRRDNWGPDVSPKILALAQKGGLLTLAKDVNRFLAVMAEPGRPFIVEKTPTNSESMGFIHLCFPNAKFIHCRRHPADTFISAFQHNMNRLHDYTYDQVAFAERYLAQDAIMNYWKSCFPAQVFELVYEELVADPEATVRRLVGFCGLEWEDACLNFHERKSTVRTYSSQQVRQPIYAGSVGRWKAYEKHLAPLLSALGRTET